MSNKTGLMYRADACIDCCKFEMFSVDLKPEATCPPGNSASNRGLY